MNMIIKSIKTIIADFELLNVYAPMMKSEDDEYDQLLKRFQRELIFRKI